MLVKIDQRLLPTSTKSNKNENEASENSDTTPTLNLDSLSSEQKLDFLCKRVDELTFYAKEIKTLKKADEEKDRKIKSLEQIVESLEQCTRRDDVVISGFNQGSKNNDVANGHKLKHIKNQKVYS